MCGACSFQCFTLCFLALVSKSVVCTQMLTGRARVEAEDAQRVLLAALNGLAGLMLLEGDPRLAVATYRQAGSRTSARDGMHLQGLIQVLL